MGSKRILGRADTGLWRHQYGAREPSMLSKTLFACLNIEIQPTKPYTRTGTADGSLQKRYETVSAALDPAKPLHNAFTVDRGTHTNPSKPASLPPKPNRKPTNGISCEILTKTRLNSPYKKTCAMI